MGKGVESVGIWFLSPNFELVAINKRGPSLVTVLLNEVISIIYEFKLNGVLVVNHSPANTAKK